MLGAKRLRILVVDDDQDSREMLVEMLSTLGHQAAQVGSGELALAALEVGPYDAVLIDLGMPNVDGLQLARSIRLTAGPDIYLIAWTGYDDERSREAARAAGFDSYLPKPVEVALLVAELARIEG
jgi:CheY-like chemotaxis protein